MTVTGIFIIIKAGVTVRSSPTRASTSDATEPDSSTSSNAHIVDDSSISKGVEANLLSDPSNFDIFNGFEKLIVEVSKDVI